MSDNELDKLLNTHFTQSTPASDFNELRRAVWSGIHARENTQPWWWRMADFIFPPQTRFAPITAALLFGMVVGIASSVNTASASNTQLGFEVFSSNYSHPLKG
jgi:hypothetical protein